ncbi:hypothetical protein V1527DRAFT_474613 [Lipomyces starkeyi]
MPQGPKIAIIGAGPGGLTLARLLQLHDLPCSIYEAEQNREERNQGGTLDLHPRAGQRALKEAGLLEEFRKYSRPEAEKDKIVLYDGTVLWDENDHGNHRPEELKNRPEIDRTRLRQILLDSVKPESISWSKKLVRVEAVQGGQYNLHFEDSVEEGFDVVVGADGAWSKVRRLLSAATPFYSGITVVELWAMDVENAHPALSKYVGDGSMFMFDEGRAIISQRNGNNCIRTYACVRQPESWVKTCGIDWTQQNAAKQALLDRYFANCSSDLKHLVLDSSEGLIPRILYMLPIGYKWETCPGVTLLGDAAHLMTPFAGVGVNLAMADALDLARELVSRKEGLVAKLFSDKQNITSAIRAYEKSMYERGEEYAQKTWHGLQAHFSATGGQERAEKIRKHAAARDNP